MKSSTIMYGVISSLICWTESLTEAAQKNATTEALFDELFTAYKPSLFPRCPGSHNVTVTIDVALRQILDLNEKEQIMTTNIWLRLRWNDCRFTWVPALYDNLTSMIVRYEDIWVPDMSIYDSASHGEMFPAIDTFKPRVYHTGYVTFLVPAVVGSVCIVNVRYFPFDTQRCSLKFGSWSQYWTEINIVNKTQEGDLGSFIENTEWTVTDMPVQSNIDNYNCCPESFSDVTYYIIITRRPAFYILTMIFPCILIACVAGLVFLLPVESGEKVSLAITVLLSLTVFLLILSESLPATSNNFPIIGQYFAVSMAIVSFSLLQSVMVLNISYRGTNGRRVHRWVRIIFLKYLGKVLCIKPVQTKDSNESSGVEMNLHRQEFLEPGCYTNTANTNNVTFSPIQETESNITQNGTTSFVQETEVTQTDELVSQILAKMCECVKNDDDNKSDKKSDAEINVEWKCLSDILDRLSLLIYLVVTIATVLIHLLQVVNNHINK